MESEWIQSYLILEKGDVVLTRICESISKTKMSKLALN